jgi:dihydroorotate dehydrogenase electron transfer subunit
VAKSRKKGPFVAEVVSNTPLNRHHYRLSLRLAALAARVFAKAIPGQFAQFDTTDIALPPVSDIPAELRDASQRKLILRRPLSFAGLEVKRSGDVLLDILYCVLGPGTLRMTTLAAGDTLSVIGPLGNGFAVPKGKKLALLVAGGMGAPPLEHMAQWLRHNHPKMDVMAFVGARSREQLPYTMARAQGSHTLLPNSTGITLHRSSPLTTAPSARRVLSRSFWPSGLASSPLLQRKLSYTPAGRR